jgi:type II secretory pathway pseudopilin PulG
MPSKLKKTPYISPLTNAFTLIELLLGVALTLIVVSVAGFGLVSILRNEYKTNAESEIRNNLNRATEFISDETRRAKEIVQNQSEIVRPSGNRIPSDAQMILALQLPNYRDGDQIIYYTTSASNPWMGPRVLHRWGPPLDRNGNYELVDSSGEVTNANWVNSALVDMISDYRQVPDTDCDQWTRIPSEIDLVNGFFVCVKGGLVRLRLNSEIPLTSTTTTRDGRSTEQDKAVYSTDTKVFARSSVAAVNTANPGLPFVVDRSNPAIPVVRPTGGGEPRISVNEPTGLCTTGCRISRGREDFVVIPTISYPVRAGDTLVITTGRVNTVYGNSYPSDQRVEIFTNQDRNAQGVIIYPTLTNNQVIYVLTDVRRGRTFNFVVTFNN